MGQLEIPTSLTGIERPHKSESKRLSGVTRFACCGHGSSIAALEVCDREKSIRRSRCYDFLIVTHLLSLREYVNEWRSKTFHSHSQFSGQFSISFSFFSYSRTHIINNARIMKRIEREIEPVSGNLSTWPHFFFFVSYGGQGQVNA